MQLCCGSSAIGTSVVAHSSHLVTAARRMEETTICSYAEVPALGRASAPSVAVGAVVVVVLRQCWLVEHAMALQSLQH